MGTHVKYLECDTELVKMMILINVNPQTDLQAQIINSD